MRAISLRPVCPGRFPAFHGEPVRVAEDRLRLAQHETRLEAAPFLVAVAGVSGGLAALSGWQGWQLFGSSDWWVWLLLAAPALVLATAFVAGLGRLASSEHHRKITIGLLLVLGAGNAAGIVLVVAALLGSSSPPTGPQLLASAFTVLLTNVVTFALAFWELDDGGPVRRALAARRGPPDFQFPQDENPQLARPGWVPTLGDYFYLSLTNSVAFSPTDAMPLTRRAKLLMGIESSVSIVTLLIVAARAVNILGA